MMLMNLIKFVKNKVINIVLPGLENIDGKSARKRRKMGVGKVAHMAREFLFPNFGVISDRDSRSHLKKKI